VSLRPPRLVKTAALLGPQPFPESTVLDRYLLSQIFHIPGPSAIRRPAVAVAKLVAHDDFQREAGGDDDIVLHELDMAAALISRGISAAEMDRE
jgi:hypothetical protein